MNRKKMLLAASAVMLVIGGVFAEREINRAAPTDLYLATGAGAIPGPGCVKICSCSSCALTISSVFTTTACANQAAIRNCAGILRNLYQNSFCTQPVYLK